MPASFIRIELLIASIERRFGVGAVQRLSQQFREQSPQVIPTGLISLDAATNSGGIPRGGVTEIYGCEGSGKTSLALQVIAEAQSLGGICAYIDAEHALCPEYVNLLGVKAQELYVSQPDSGEQAVEIVEALLRSKCFDVIAVDSIAALVPREELQSHEWPIAPGLHARLISRSLRKLCELAYRSNTALVFTNQLRDRITPPSWSGETTTTTTGGQAIKARASMRLEMKPLGVLWNEQRSRATGTRVKVKVVKNKMAAPGAECEFDITSDGGISKASSLFDLAVRIGVIEKRGEWYTHQGVRIGVERRKVIWQIETNDDLRCNIEVAVRHLMLQQPAGMLKITAR